MNKQMEDFARNTLKKGLSNCTDFQQLMFKKMYSFDNLELPMNDVVDNMEIKKLDWAMQQVKRTLDEKEGK